MEKNNNALEKLRGDYEKLKLKCETLGMAIALLNECVNEIQSDINKLDLTVRDVMFENLELRQAQWRGE